MSVLIFCHTVAQAEVIVPPGLEVKESNIPTAGRGVFAKCVIPKHDFFGPFVGKKVTAEEAKHYKDSPYVWEVRLVSNLHQYCCTFCEIPPRILGLSKKK